MTVSGTQHITHRNAEMRFSVDAWDVSYGTALAVEDEELPASVARIETDVETPADRWAPINAEMRFSVDAWDVSYGTALAVEDEELPASVARIETDVETPADRWAPIAA